MRIQDLDNQKFMEISPALKTFKVCIITERKMIIIKKVIITFLLFWLTILIFQRFGVTGRDIFGFKHSNIIHNKILPNDPSTTFILDGLRRLDPVLAKPES